MRLICCAGCVAFFEGAEPTFIRAIALTHRSRMIQMRDEYVSAFGAASRLGGWRLEPRHEVTEVDQV
jgi:hypothetical protein